MIFRDVKICRKNCHSMVRYYFVPPKKKTTKERTHMSEKNCREETSNILLCHVAAAIWGKVCSKSYCTLNSRLSRIIFKIQGLFKDLPKLPLKFKHFSRISRTCLKFKDLKDFFKDVVTLHQQIRC